MDRAAHLAWAKARALEYLPADPEQAFASLASDLKKHAELAEHSGLMLGMMLLMGGHLDTPRQVREWIEGFN